MKKKWSVVPAVIATAIMSFSGVLIETSMNVTFPTLMRTFNTDASGVQWVTTGYLLALAIVIPLSAYLVRNFAIQRLFITANLLFILGVVVDFLAPSLFALLAGRVFQGIGTGIALPLMYHIVLNQAPKKKQGTFIGIGAMTTSLAPAIGPTYGGIISAHFSWREIFLFLLPVLLLSLIIGSLAIPYEKVARSDKFNLQAFIFLGLALGTLLLALENISLPWFVASFVFFAAFYYFNQRHQLLNLSVFKNSSFVFLTMGVLAFQATALGLSFIFPNYLQLGLKTSVTQAGLFMLPGALLAALLAPVAGILYDKIGAKKPILTGFAFGLIGLFLLSLFFQQANFVGLLILDVTFMLGTGLIGGNLIALALVQLKDTQADGNSIINTLQQFVGAASTAIVASLITHGKTIASGSQQGVWFLFSAVLIASLLFMLTQRKTN